MTYTEIIHALQSITLTPAQTTDVVRMAGEAMVRHLVKETGTQDQLNVTNPATQQAVDQVQVEVEQAMEGIKHFHFHVCMVGTCMEIVKCPHHVIKYKCPLLNKWVCLQHHVGIA